MMDTIFVNGPHMYHAANCRELKDGVMSGTDYLELL
jgi:hypothetical protein